VKVSWAKVHFCVWALGLFFANCNSSDYASSYIYYSSTVGRLLGLGPRAKALSLPAAKFHDYYYYESPAALLLAIFKREWDSRFRPASLPRSLALLWCCVEEVRLRFGELAIRESQIGMMNESRVGGGGSSDGGVRIDDELNFCGGDSQKLVGFTWLIADSSKIVSRESSLLWNQFLWMEKKYDSLSVSVTIWMTSPRLC